jgi:gamma-glutamylcyclotransferase (GGCT)/AIG2-like uncharacterized protein YtfP
MLFAYGTLQDPDILGAVLGRVVDMASLKAAQADGFVAITYPGRPYPALAPSPGASAPGKLITGLSEKDWALLDAFEGEEYCRASMEIRVGNLPQLTQAYFPTIVIPAQGAIWRLEDWTGLHKPRVLAGEVASATALRHRLSTSAPHTSRLRHP